jgi:hypothetical protein
MFSNHLGARDQGIPAGMLIMTGGVTEAIAVMVGVNVVARFRSDPRQGESREKCEALRTSLLAHGMQHTFDTKYCARHACAERGAALRKRTTRRSLVQLALSPETGR